MHCIVPLSSCEWLNRCYCWEVAGVGLAQTVARHMWYHCRYCSCWRPQMISIKCDKQGVTVVSKNGHESAGQFTRPSAELSPLDFPVNEMTSYEQSVKESFGYSVRMKVVSAGQSCRYWCKSFAIIITPSCEQLANEACVGRGHFTLLQLFEEPISKPNVPFASSLPGIDQVIVQCSPF